ncbi:MAG: 2-hydroxychromene-2-carboxylate isomerase [Gammaproteobacteria bacterium]|nr:2-hydroxychromene-2-carboxylate isomerase [Gammaproteobacteria bacterium]
MAGPIDFYFDFSSAYSAIARLQIADIAERHGRELRWQAISLGVIFRELRHAPPSPDTAKGRYIWHDVERSAREAGMAWRWPDPFPFNSIPAARAFHWLQAHDERHALPFLHAMFEGSFSEGRNLSTPDAVAGLAHELGIDADALLAGMAEPEIKARLQAATADAVVAGVFGAPTMLADGEMFWGADRLAYLDRWLQYGDDRPAGHPPAHQEPTK